MNIDKIITTTTEDPNYIQCWPLTAQLAKHWFDCEVILGFITDRSEDDPVVENLRKYGTVKLFKPIEGIPEANQAKVTRMYLATLYPDNICTLNDVDIAILQDKFLLNSLQPVPKNNIAAIGANAYMGGEDRGKFPMIYTSALGTTFKEIVNPNDYDYETLLKTWIGSRVVDHKEDISSHPSKFSDESLLRALLSIWDKPNRVTHIHRNFRGCTAIERIDRIHWAAKTDLLKDDWYIDAHLPRPLLSHRNQIQPILDRFNITEIE